jgi:hypothetical protein
VTDQERISLLTLVRGHSSIVLVGFPIVGVLRAMESVLQVQENQVTPDLKMGLLRGDHPDFIIRDGRDLEVKELRELIRDTTASPAIYSKKYLLLYYLDHAYYTSYPTLLKLIEEPPIHLSTIICANFIQRVPDTIRSRSLIFHVNGLDNTELSWWLDFKGKTDYRNLRIRACGGDPELAEALDVATLKDWAECWEPFVATPGDLGTNFLTNWSGRFEKMDNLTQLACWYLLGSLLSKKLVTHPRWLEMGALALQARNTIRNGKINKQQSITYLIRMYALARTVKNRVRV